MGKTKNKPKAEVKKTVRPAAKKTGPAVDPKTGKFTARK